MCAQHVVTAFKSLPMPSMPSPGGCSSVGEAPSLSFSPLPAGTFAIGFPKGPNEEDAHPCVRHGIAPPPPTAHSLAMGGGGPPALWTHVKEPLRRCVPARLLPSHGRVALTCSIRLPGARSMLPCAAAEESCCEIRQPPSLG